MNYKPTSSLYRNSRDSSKFCTSLIYHSQWIYGVLLTAVSLNVASATFSLIVTILLFNRATCNSSWYGFMSTRKATVNFDIVVVIS